MKPCFFYGGGVFLILGMRLIELGPKTNKERSISFERPMEGLFEIPEKFYVSGRHSPLLNWAQYASAVEIKELSRHSDIRTSFIYVQAAQGKLYDIVNRKGIRGVSQIVESKRHHQSSR